MTAGFSLAQAVSCIIQHRCGISISTDEETSIALLMNIDDDCSLPANAASDAERELLTALAENRVTATALDSRNNQVVSIPADEWRRLSISPNLDGYGDEVVYAHLRYRDVRLLPSEVVREWPFRQRAQRPTLRVVGGSITEERAAATVEPISATLEPVASKRGRRPAYGWDSFHKELARLIEEEGPPNPENDPNWNFQKVEDRMREWCVKTWRQEPGRSTLKDKISKYLKTLTVQ